MILRLGTLHQKSDSNMLLIIRKFWIGFSRRELIALSNFYWINHKEHLGIGTDIIKSLSWNCIIAKWPRAVYIYRSNITGFLGIKIYWWTQRKCFKKIIKRTPKLGKRRSRLSCWPVCQLIIEYLKFLVLKMKADLTRFLSCRTPYLSLKGNKIEEDHMNLINLIQRHTLCRRKYCLRENKNSELSCRFIFSIW